MARSSAVAAVGLAVLVVASVAFNNKAHGAAPEKKSDADNQPLVAITLKEFQGEMRIKPVAQGHSLAISEIVRIKDGARIANYMVSRKVYAISPGQKAPFKEVTLALRVPIVAFGDSCPPQLPVVPDGPEFDTWVFKPPADKGVMYLVTASGAVVFSDGEIAICSFDPVLIVDGKAVPSELNLPARWNEPPQAEATKKAPSRIEAAPKDGKTQKK